MDSGSMRELFLTHRDAERARDFDAIMRTFSEDCYLEDSRARFSK